MPLADSELRQEILKVGCLVVQHGGLEALSFRRVAAEVGCSEARVLEHFADEPALIQALLDHVFSKLVMPELSEDPFEDICAAFITLRKHYRKNRWALLIVSNGSYYTRVAIPIVENFLKCFNDCGVPGIGAFWAYRTAWAYMIGTLMVEVPQSGPPSQRRAQMQHDLSVERTPRLLSILPEVKNMQNDFSFEAGIASVVRGAIDTYQARNSLPDTHPAWHF